MDGERKTYQVGECRVTIDPALELVTTEFADGKRLHAQPNYDEESLARARALGYKGRKGCRCTGRCPACDRWAVWRMNADHDLAHSMLAAAMGLPYSPTLWAVAHGEQYPHEDAMREERAVFLLQRMANQGLEAVADSDHGAS